MSYNPNIPAAGTRINQTYNLITTNFNQANLIFGSSNIDGGGFVGDHIAFNNATTANRGKHAKVRLVELGAAPSTAVDEAALYTKVGTNPAQTNLFYRGENNGFEYQITKTVSAFTATFGATTTGWSFLPGNLLMLYGTMSLSANSSTTITFAGLNLPDFNDANYNIQFTAFKNSNNSSVSLDAWVRSKATNNFVIYNASNTFTGTWLAIGK